jgi:hypothetical protein
MLAERRKSDCVLRLMEIPAACNIRLGRRIRPGGYSGRRFGIGAAIFGGIGDGRYWQYTCSHAVGCGSGVRLLAEVRSSGAVVIHNTIARFPSSSWNWAFRSGCDVQQRGLYLAVLTRRAARAARATKTGGDVLGVRSEIPHPTRKIRPATRDGCSHNTRRQPTW